MKKIFCFLKNFFAGFGASQQEEYRNNKPSAYSLESGLSPEFIQKYGLSNRQAEVTEALLKGKSDREISALLNIALNTVQVHLKNIYRKTGARGRYALMALVGLGK
jgi:DNA-binding CsgD family transcriptional regulator